MSRSGYSDGMDTWALIRYRGQVASAIRGKRGQKMLRELKAALEAMPKKRLVRDMLKNGQGEVCALGALAQARGVDTTVLDEDDDGYYDSERAEHIAATFGVARQLAAEIMYLNDEAYWHMSPEKRWEYMHRWVSEHIQEAS